MEIQPTPPAPELPDAQGKRLTRWPGDREAGVFLIFTVFVIAYGLTPLLGGDGLGLVGADEPRYAQIAHEMLSRFDSAHTLGDRLSACVTPYLYGHPWLEKPALYYWRAMFTFQDFGVHDWSARLPSASFAFVMAALIYLHMRRFRAGGHLDAALIIVAPVPKIIGFARGASTDMQIAAPLAIGLLGWYAWYETGSKFWLFDIYFFTGVATLAKGPVAPFLAAITIVALAFLRREQCIVLRTFWWPGVLSLLRHGAALVHRRADTEPHLLPRVFLSNKPAAFCHRPLSALAAVLVLPRGGGTGHDAVDGHRRARSGRRNPDLQVEQAAPGIPAVPRPTAPVTHFLSFWQRHFGRSFPSCSSLCRSPSCRDTSCRRSRRSPFLPETTSSAAAFRD